MTLWWRMVAGKAYRRPGTIRSIMNERIHWSVYHHTFPTEGVNSVLPRCWSFENLAQTDLNIEPLSWPPREAEPHGRMIEESGKSSVEIWAIQIWRYGVLEAIENAAGLGDREEDRLPLVQLSEAVLGPDLE